jgi:biopolymer transport protein ExbB/TolQ
MEINLVELWSGMGLPVKFVVILLTLQAMGCVAVVFDRVLLLTQSSKRARAFADTVQPAMEAAQYDQVLAVMAESQPNHLSGFLETGLRTFVARLHAGDDARQAAEFSRRALERKGDATSRSLNRGMNILASTGSTAPFVGLLGTVLGIINAFKMIAATGSGGIGTIGAAIGEALVVTGYGLMVAIPAVLVFNWLSSRIASYEAGLLNAGSELIDRLEMSFLHQPVARPQAQPSYAPAAAQPQPGTASSRPVPRPVPAR